MSTRMLLRGGLVADGIGRTTRPGDVLTDGQAIVSVDARGADPAGCEVLDLAPGSLVCPGFIDAHAHAEGPLLGAGRVDGALAQGVTTLVVGQDGESWIGANAGTARYLNRYFAPVNGALDPARGLTVAGYRDAVAGRLTQNVAVLASQGTIRHNLTGLRPGPLDPGERAAARRDLEDALAAGAVGLSSGLDYLPSRFGDIAEVADIARPLAAAGRPYVSHLRGYGPGVRAGLDELVAVGAEAASGCTPVTCGARRPISRRRSGRPRPPGSPSPLTCTRTERRARSSRCCCSRPACRPPGPEQTLATLADPGQRAALVAQETLSEGFLRHVRLGCLPDGSARFAGQTVTEAARSVARPAGEWILDLLVSSGLQAGGHLHRPALTDADLDWLAADDRHCAARTASTRGSIRTPAGTGRSRGSPGTTWPAVRRRRATAGPAPGGERGRRLRAGRAGQACPWHGRRHLRDRARRDHRSGQLRRPAAHRDRR